MRSSRVLRPHGVSPAEIIIDRGVIERIEPLPRSAPDESSNPIIDVGDALIMPGLVDTHVHINEPGRTDWEGFATASRAAAAGGVTTIIDMPLNSIPATTNVAALKNKLAAANGQCMVDYGFWGGLVPGNSHEIQPLADAGALGFKCFLVPSGVDEFPNVREDDLRNAMPILARRNAVLLVHAESPDSIRALASPQRHYQTYLQSRPPEAERAAIAMMIRLCEEYDCPIHIVHLSSAESLPAIAAAKHRGLPMTVETCPHYLAISAEQIPEGSTVHKCAPPIRDAANREELWSALRDGVIDMVVSDHSPCPPALKGADTGDFATAWGGIASLQLGLPILWTQMRQRDIGVENLARWMSAAPARLAGLNTPTHSRKGLIAPGYDADLVVWNPEQNFIVNESMIHHRHKHTPYLGMELFGQVQMTFLRGNKVFDHGEVASHCSGKWIQRGSA